MDEASPRTIAYSRISTVENRTCFGGVVAVLVIVLQSGIVGVESVVTVMMFIFVLCSVVILWGDDGVPILVADLQVVAWWVDHQTCMQVLESANLVMVVCNNQVLQSSSSR